MESIKVRQRVGEDSILQLEIPVGLSGQDVEVVAIYQATRKSLNVLIDCRLKIGR